MCVSECVREARGREGRGGGSVCERERDSQTE